MKYGLLTHIGFGKNGENHRRIISMGDVFECLAIRNIYESMGIRQDELQICYQYELNEYSGEYVVLPINIYALNLDYSRRIIPVFLGLTIGGINKLTDQNKLMLRRFEPIGCRDERTMRTMIENGISAYTQGCLVATFSTRPVLETQKKVFIVNVEAGVKDYIPKELLSESEFVTHDYYLSEKDFLNGSDIYSIGESLIEKYTKEAKLVITSKYHSAIISLALGIPVVFVIENNYYKYTWLEKFIPIYEPKDYANIDWNPKTVTIPDEEKAIMLEIARERIKETYEKNKKICELSELRERLDIMEYSDIFYGNYALEYIKSNWEKNIEIEYAFWGATYTSQKLNHYIHDNYPNAKLKKVFDWSVRNPINYADGIYIPESVDKIKDCDLFIFVTGNSASEAAEELFNKINRRNETYFLCQRRVLERGDI